MKKVKLSENFLNDVVDISGALPFIIPTKIYYKLYTSSLVGSFGAYLEVSSNFGAVFGLSRIYGDDKDGNATQTQSGKIEKNFTNFDYVDKNGNINDFQNITLPSIDFVLQQSSIIPMIEKVKSKWTLEAIQDYIKLSQASNDENNTFNEIINSELMTEILTQVDYRCFQLMKKKSFKKKITIPTSNQTFDYFDIIQEIQKNGLEMAAHLFAPVEISAFCSKSVACELMSHPEFKSHKKTNGDYLHNNVYFQGSINNINIYVDLFGFSNDEKFALLGVKDVSRTDNASVIFTPRKISFYSGANFEDSNQYIFSTLQYGLAFNPSDNITETNDGDSNLLSYLTF